MPCPVICWELLARDLRKQQDFFGRLFDWEISGKPGQNWASVATGMADGTITQAMRSFSKRRHCSSVAAMPPCASHDPGCPAITTGSYCVRSCPKTVSMVFCADPP